MNYLSKSIMPVLFFIISIILTGCNGGEMEKKQTAYSNINNIPAAAWEKLSEKKIYFGHQSVGFNIVDGINALIKEYPQIKLNIVETNKLAGFKKGVFAHSRIGKNCEPETKIDEFNQFIETGLEEQPDIAALKYCYVDVTGKTDVEKIFEEYYKPGLSRNEAIDLAIRGLNVVSTESLKKENIEMITIEKDKLFSYVSQDEIADAFSRLSKELEKEKEKKKEK